MSECELCGGLAETQTGDWTLCKNCADEIRWEAEEEER